MASSKRRITGEPGTPPRLAVPDLIALSPDKETQDAARVIGEVLWDDMNFEREFYMIPRDTYKSIPVSTAIGEVAFDRWRELGADGVVVGTVQRAATGIRVEMRLYSVRARQQSYGREYTGAAANPRVYAHTMARFTCRSAACAASPGPSWRSPRIATAIRWRTPSRSAR